MNVLYIHNNFEAAELMFLCQLQAAVSAQLPDQFYYETVVQDLHQNISDYE